VLALIKLGILSAIGAFAGLMIANPILALILFVIGSIIVMLADWVKRVGSLSGAWTQFANGFYNIIGSIKIGFAEMINSLLNQWGAFKAALGISDKVYEAGLKLEREAELNALKKHEAVLTFTRTNPAGITKGLESGMNLGVNGLGNNNDYSYAGAISDIAGNTSKIVDSMELTEEDLSYLRDIAERDIINRYTTAEITIEQNNNNNISSEMDIDGVIGRLNDGLEETIAIAVEGGAG
jgi:hypothetical protein